MTPKQENNIFIIRMLMASFTVYAESFNIVKRKDLFEMLGFYGRLALQMGSNCQYED